MAGLATLSAFQEQHAGFLDLFLEHQCALMGLELERSRAALEELSVLLAVHAAVEDQVLMPLFLEHGLEAEGARRELFEAEHRRLPALLEGLLEQQARLEAAEDAGRLDRRAALEVLEQGYTFKHLFDHHTQREDRAFYPALEAALGASERRETCSRMQACEREQRADRGLAPIEPRDARA